MLDYGNIWIIGFGILLATVAFAFVFNFLYYPRSLTIAAYLRTQAKYSHF